MKQESKIINNDIEYIKEKAVLINNQVIDDIYNKTNDFAILGLYTRMLAYQQQNGLYYGNQKELAKICDISTKTLNKGLKKLREIGYLDMIRQGQQKNTIYIVYMQKQEGAK